MKMLENALEMYEMEQILPAGQKTYLQPGNVRNYALTQSGIIQIWPVCKNKGFTIDENTFTFTIVENKKEINFVVRCKFHGTIAECKQKMKESLDYEKNILDLVPTCILLIPFFIWMIFLRKIQGGKLFRSESFWGLFFGSLLFTAGYTYSTTGMLTMVPFTRFLSPISYLYQVLTIFWMGWSGISIIISLIRKLDTLSHPGWFFIAGCFISMTVYVYLPALLYLCFCVKDIRSKN